MGLCNFLFRKPLFIFLISCLVTAPFTHVNAQMRQVYLDSDIDLELTKFSFYSPSEGYVAFQKWVGYTTDSGRTFTKKYVTVANVNYNGYSVNLTFGFYINGVKAFNQNRLILYGHYGLVPAILYSINGGSTFTLVYHSRYSPFEFKTGITDMVFPQNGSVGYAVDADRILKSTDGGVNWYENVIDPDSYFTNLEAIDDNTVFALCTQYNANKLLKTTTGGLTWSQVTLPSLTNGKMNYAYFLNSTTGWVSMTGDNDVQNIYKTVDGALTWTLMNDPLITPFKAKKIKFTDALTGYALSGTFAVYKTTDGGALWEPLQRDNNYSYLGYSHTNFAFTGTSQFWAGGGGFIELSNNGGGTPLPIAYFKADTTGMYATNIVNLLNFSRQGYTYKWLLNNQQIATSYNANYTRDISRLRDTVTLIISNGTNTDTLIKYLSFAPPIFITSFTPTSAGAGTTINIKGSNFTGVTSVRFGGTAATSFTVLSDTAIRAVVGSGSSGSVTAAKSNTIGSLGGFIFIPPPTISSFSPDTAGAGTLVLITGTNFSTTNAVSFGNIPASFNVVNATTISATVPSGNSGSVKVTTPGGSASLAGFVSKPAISSFTPTQGTTGTVVIITGTSLTNVTSVSIGGVNATSFTINSANQITAITGAQASGNVVVTAPGGSASIAGFTWMAPPVIQAFSPTRGPAGTSVTITGSGFNNTAAGNMVLFGSVKAVITAATNTSLTVTVPQGVIYEPIMVVTNNLTAVSKQPFLITFPNGGSITAGSFSGVTNINLDANTYPYNVLTRDMDKDGKNDVIISQNNGNLSSLSGAIVFRNTSTGNSTSFAPGYSMLSGSHESLAASDLDGDGREDIVVAGGGSGTQIKMFRNISSPGNILFDTMMSLAASSVPKWLCLADVDGDGKIDIITRLSSGSATVLYKNTSEPGRLSFKTAVNIGNIDAQRNTIASDLNGDGKPELIFSTGYILPNTSTPDVVSFGTTVTLPNYAASYIAVGDIDNDGQNDLVCGDYNQSKMYVLKNTGNGSTISFAAPIILNAVSNPSSIYLSDMDGDGRLDITARFSDYNTAVYKNTTTSGNISFAAKVNYRPGQPTSYGLAIADMNNDGKNDIVTSSRAENAINIYINNVKKEPFIVSFNPQIGIAGTVITIAGNNFTGITAVSFNGIPATAFTVINDSTITATAPASTTGDITVTNSAGASSLGTFSYGIPPVITSISSLTATVNASVIISGNNFSNIAAGNIVRFGSVKAKVISSSATSITAEVPLGSEGKPISVTVNNLTAYARNNFYTGFAAAQNSITPYTFNIRTSVYDVSSLASLADVDGDGKVDLISSRTNSADDTVVSIIRNQSITGNIQFAAAVDFPAGGTGKVTSGDLDGDGKLDIAIAYKNIISLYRNRSTPGVFSLEPKIDFLTNSNSDTAPFEAAIKDLNADGKPDIAVAHYDTRTIAVLKNKSSAGTLSFGNRVDYIAPNGSYFERMYLYDLDGDDKPEIIATTASGAVSFSIFQNTSTIADISFTALPDMGNADGEIQVGDIDMDGKNDIVFSKRDTVSVYRNISTPGTINFAPKANFYTGITTTTGNYLNVNDLDGDGKPDISITAGSITTGNVSVFKNNSTPGNISLSPKINYTTPNLPTVVLSADADNDGKTDLFVYSNSVGGGMGAFRNNNGANNISITSFAPVSVVQGTAVTITGYGLSAVSTVSFGNVPADSFIIHSDNRIIAYPGSGATGNVTVSNGTDMATLTGFSYSTKPAIAGIAPATAAAGTTVVITGANLTGTTSVSFGGVAAQSFVIHSPDSISAVVAPGSISGVVKLTNGTDSAVLNGFTMKQPPVIYSFTPASASASTTVTIAGKNLANTVAVDFSGKEAYSFTVVNNDTITAVASNVNTGNITVTTDAGSASLGTFTNTNAGTIGAFYPTVATQGSEVLITGTNMAAVTAVRFGNAPAASFRITSPTSIIAVVDTGSSGTIRLTAANGLNNQIAGFTYVPLTQPGIASFAPARAAEGTIVHISGVNFDNVTAVSIGGTAASSFTVVSPQLIKAVVANAASGSVIVITGGGTATKNGFVFTTLPYINSFSPKAALPGSRLNIYGANFSSTPSSNTVYLGAVRATVVAATANQLTVVVPKHATFSKITVNTGGYTAYSNQSFIPLFAPVGPLNAATFTQRIDSSVANKPGQITMADMDNDGKADLSVSGGNTSGIRTYSQIRNVSSGGNQLFLAPVTLSSFSNAETTVFADYDGDGLPDISAGSTGYNPLYVAKNNSVAGNISFGTPLQLTTGSVKGSFSAHDIDGDGKTDIAVCSTDVGAAVLRNTSTASISFASLVSFAMPLLCANMVTEDVDGDRRPDMIVYNPDGFHVFRNISTAGNTAFEAYRSFYVSGRCIGFTVADINQDGYPEIIAVSLDAQQLVVFENNCKPGFIYFKPIKNVYTGFSASTCVVNDLDGDSRLDIIAGPRGGKELNLYRNSSTGNTDISFDPAVTLTYLTTGVMPAAADIDGDNRPEIMLAQPLANAISFFKNNTAKAPGTSAFCGGGSTSFVSNITGNSYQWQVNTGSGFVNISNNGTYSGATSATLQLNTVPAAWHGFVYRCRVDNKYSDEHALKFENYWTGAVNSFWNNPGNWSCNSVPDGNTDVIIESGTVIVNANGICRTLIVNPTVSFTINNAVQLTITH